MGSFTKAGSLQPDTSRMSVRGDLLTLAFNQACQQGELDTATQLLKELDIVLLGEAMGWTQREASLKTMRSYRDRLELLRIDASLNKSLEVHLPQHHTVA